MRHAWLALALLAAGCSTDWSAALPHAPAPPSEPAALPGRLYGRPLEVVRETRLVPSATGSVSAVAEVIRAGSIPGVAQVDANDCGPAAIATLLGFYRLRPQGASDPLQAVKASMPPQQWGTRLEEARDYLNATGFLRANTYRDGQIDGLMDLVRAGRPVPVVVTLDSSVTRMHWLLVIGQAIAPSKGRFVLCKNPSDTDPLAITAFSEATFLAFWENDPLRSQWWSGLMAGVADTNVQSYRRPYLDVGALLPP